MSCFELTLENADRDQTRGLTLENAVDACRRIEAVIAPLGAHCALTGSCLYKGESTKDIDVIIYSHQGIASPYSKDAVIAALTDAGLASNFYQTTPNYLDKDVVLCDIDGGRADLFFFP